MLTGEQVRMARAALRWKLGEVADRANVSINTVKRIEAGERAMADTLDKLQRAFEDGGLIFMDDGELRDGGPGVRFRDRRRP